MDEILAELLMMTDEIRESIHDEHPDWTDEQVFAEMDRRFDEAIDDKREE